MSLRNKYEDMDASEAFRRVREMDLSSNTMHVPWVLHDPILTPLLATYAGLGGVAFTIGSASITYASIATAIITTAVTVGLQLLLAPKPPKPESGKVPKTEPIPYRWWGVGRDRLAGAHMLWEAQGQYLFSVQAIAAHKIKAYNRYWLHDDEVFLNPDGTTDNDDQGRYGNNVQVLKRLGLSTETAYSEIVSKLTTPDVWTSAHRGDGQASVAIIATSTAAKNQATRFPYGAPSLSVEADLALCWDFRDPGQSPTNPETWKWTQNSAVILCWHLFFNEFGFRRDYRVGLLPVLDMWVEEADICDEDVTLAAGGTEKRYQCNGYDTAENGPKSGLNSILATCDGWLCERGDGALLLTVGKFRENRVEVLTDDDIRGHQIQYDVQFEDECNRLVPKFTYPATDYSTSDTDFFEDTAAQIVSGRVLSQDADYGWCHQWRQARRLGKRDWLRIQQRVKGSLDVRLSGINAVYSRWIRLATPIRLPRLDGKLIENKKANLSLMTAGFSLEINQHPENIDAWNPATDEGAQPPVPSKPNASDLDAPTVNAVIATASSGSVYLQVKIVDPEQEDLTPTVRYQVADIGGGVPGGWSEKINTDAVAIGGFITLVTDVVPADKLLNVEAALINAKGKYSDWSPAIQVASVSDPTAPVALVSFINSDSAPHLGKASFGMTTASDGHVKTVALYRVATGAAFNKLTATAFASLAVGSLGNYSYVDGDPTRVNLVTDGDFATAPGPWTLGTGWTISGGVANMTAVAAGQSIRQPMSPVNGTWYRIGANLVVSAGGIVMRFTPTGNSGLSHLSSGLALDRIQSGASNTEFRIVATSASNTGTVDNVVVYAESADCAPQGVWDYYAVPINGSGKMGLQSGPLTISII